MVFGDNIVNRRNTLRTGDMERDPFADEMHARREHFNNNKQTNTTTLQTNDRYPADSIASVLASVMEEVE